MPSDSSLLLMQVASTLFLTGLIWFVQVVHYPLFDRVGAREFQRYHDAHKRLTTWIVGPPMLVEALTSLITAFRVPTGVPSWQAWTGFALVGAIWASTVWLQVPQHDGLSGGFEERAYRRLVRTNWVRVLAWTLRSILVLSWIA